MLNHEKNWVEAQSSQTKDVQRAKKEKETVKRRAQAKTRLRNHWRKFLEIVLTNTSSTSVKAHHEAPTSLNQVL